MRKILILILVILTSSCAEYKPIFSSEGINFQLIEINFEPSDKISKDLSKKLSNFAKENSQKKISISLMSKVNEQTLSKDSKGNPVILEISLTTNLIVFLDNKELNNFNFNEKFSFNNQSNKFELKQYKNTVVKNLTDKIFDKIIFQLRIL